MAATLDYPAELAPTNRKTAIADSDNVRGGRRTPVADRAALYALADRPDQLKEGATVVRVLSDSASGNQPTDLLLVDIAKIGEAAGWQVIGSGGAITLTLDETGPLLAGEQPVQPGQLYAIVGDPTPLPPVSGGFGVPPDGATWNNSGQLQTVYVFGLTPTRWASTGWVLAANGKPQAVAVDVQAQTWQVDTVDAYTKAETDALLAQAEEDAVTVEGVQEVVGLKTFRNKLLIDEYAPQANGKSARLVVDPALGLSFERANKTGPAAKFIFNYQSGDLTLTAGGQFKIPPTGDDDSAATKQYVDEAVAAAGAGSGSGTATAIAPQWVAGPQTGGALVYDNGYVYRVKQDLANSETVPGSNPSKYLLIGPSGTAVTPSFRARDSAAAKAFYSIPEQTFQQVLFNQLERQAGETGGTGWQAGQSRYVAPKGGTYLVAGGVEFQPGAPGADAVFYLMVYVNGNRYADLFIQGCAAAGGTFGSSGNTEVTLTVGDYVELFSWHNAGPGSQLVQSTYRSAFSARLLNSI